MLVKLEFFVPIENAEHVKNALFELGVGAIGNYSHCAWQTEGDGQFKPGAQVNLTLVLMVKLSE